MTDFQGFSEVAKLYAEQHAVVEELLAAYERDTGEQTSAAAKLYAEHLEVVQEVRAAYERDAQSLVRALEERVREAVAPQHFVSYSTQTGNVFWWLGGGKRQQAVTLWFEGKKPPYVSANHLLLSVDASLLKGGPDAARLRELAGSAVGFEEPSALVYYALRLRVSFDGVESLPAAADKIARALRALAKFYST